MKISNQELLSELKRLRADECTVLAKFIYFLAEAMTREIHLSEGYSSLFDFLVRKFSYSEGSAARRVAAVKVYKLFPEALKMIAENRVTLSNLHLIAKHMNAENVQELVKACAGKNKLEMESYLAKKFYQGTPSPKRDIVKPVATPTVEIKSHSFNFDESFEQPTQPQNVRVSVTLDHETFEKLKCLQELSGKDQISDALDLALEFYLAKKDPEKIPSKATQSKPMSASQREARPVATAKRLHIPISLRREVYKRDQGQCTFCSADGMRCTARRHLEFDHVIPVSYGGQNTLENLQLMCSQHNKHRWKFRNKTTRDVSQHPLFPKK